MICLMLVITIFSGMSTSVETTNSKFFERFEIELTPENKDVTTTNANGDPVVVITYPQDGSHLSSNYLEVLGYAMDPDDMYYVEWTYECRYGTYFDNETLDPAEYITFRIRIFDIPTGFHTVTVTFFDMFDNAGSDSVTVYYGINNPPEKPNRPEGPDSGAVGTEYTYSTHSTDSDGNLIRYGWDWDGDNVVDEWTGFYESGATVEEAHIWNFEGIYNVKVKAEDDEGTQSIFSTPKTVHISSNSPPTKPETPYGDSSGRPGVSYSYTTSSDDPQEHRIYYMVDWDDGTELEWVGPFDSGSIAGFSHKWEAKGTYQLKVKAIDDPNGDGDLSDGLESVWSDPLPISMPRSRSIKAFENLFVKFPFIQALFACIKF